MHKYAFAGLFPINEVSFIKIFVLETHGTFSRHFAVNKTSFVCLAIFPCKFAFLVIQLYCLFVDFSCVGFSACGISCRKCNSAFYELPIFKFSLIFIASMHDDICSDIINPSINYCFLIHCKFPFFASMTHDVIM